MAVDDTRYIIGIDLGTTNCALTYIDAGTVEDERVVKVFDVPQLVAPGEVQALPLLPSFIYLPGPHEVAPETMSLPWTGPERQFAVGAYARDMASQVPGKIVSSAKSWLCVEGLDRRAAMLPWNRQEGERRISPVEAAQYLLDHLRDAWNHRMAESDESLRLERQEVYLTVPASFDAVARELTAEAAQKVGLSVRLLEEPQAAFYAWLYDQGAEWREHVSEGDIILVCDIGGGTTDFTLIAVTEQDGSLGLERIAVGDHILLGGDNMDLALAYSMVAKIKEEQGVELDGRQIAALTHSCRAAKEHLGQEDADFQKLTILGRGTGVVGSSISTDLTRQHMWRLLVDGFFPACEISEQVSERRKIGLRSFGLDYASDPAVTRHLATFINRHSFKDTEGNPILPRAVLFNGGVTKSDVLRNRVVEVLNDWGREAQPTEILTERSADLAVAYGAVWYGNVQRTGGVRIKSGSPRSYYIGIESTMPAVPGFKPPVQALCVVNFGMEEGTEAMVPSEGIGLVVGEPTEFRFFSSTVRTEDQIGKTLDAWTDQELVELPPVVAELPADQGDTPVGFLVPVTLETNLTEIGTLQIWCHDVRGAGRWRLEFELRQE